MRTPGPWLKTRPQKSHRDAGTLRERWLLEAAGVGFDPGTVMDSVRAAAAEVGRQALGQASGQPLDRYATVTAGALQGAASTRAMFSRADVAGQVAALLPVDGRSAAGVVALVEALTGQALGLDPAVPIGDHPSGRTPRASDARWAGAEVLAAEARVLSLAERGRGGGYGRIPASSLILALHEAGLDQGQHDAVQALGLGGDFLTVVTAPAGAGKTRTIGVAAQAWTRVGYRVLGLAPSARAAAELSAPTGAPADTLAKWILENDRRGLLLPEARARYVLDERTVVVVDEASMANTHDLDVLITAAARASAKVVLVGDPAQIGVVRGPGGMLAALAAAGHGVELGTVHRFTHEWEADASLRLRRGDPDVLPRYLVEGRVHACTDTVDAVTAVHAHWTRERGRGKDVLMMARTRADVDTLNTAARATAVASGEVHGPAIRFGERDWQQGDLLRARRNDRRLTVGEEGHVRNGDRYRVTSVDPAGLRVEHLDRGERAFLPADYVAVHGEYGWATTITAAQGATVDVGLVLVRPGIDREHLYVAMTRGRDANHAYVTPDTTSEIDHHGPPAVGRRAATPDERVLDVLAAALGCSGAQDAAHTARDRARTRAAEAAEQAARRAAEPVVPVEHAARAAELTQHQAERNRLAVEQQGHRAAAAAARAQLAATSRLRPGRRGDLHDAILGHDRAADAIFPDTVRLDRAITDLTRQVTADTKSRDAEQHTRTARATRALTEQREPALGPAFPVESGIAPARMRRVDAHSAASEDLRVAERNRRHSRDHSHERGRDDGHSIGR